MTGEAESIEIVVADDHPVVRSGLRSVLAEHGDIEVVGEAADAEETIRKVNAFKPDVLVLDLMMPGGPTVDSISELRKISPDTQIIVLTMQSDPAYARTALREGASGFILKEAAKAEGDEKTGLEILRRALSAPTRQIAENSRSMAVS